MLVFSITQVIVFRIVNTCSALPCLFSIGDQDPTYRTNGYSRFISMAVCVVASSYQDVEFRVLHGSMRVDRFLQEGCSFGINGHADRASIGVDIKVAHGIEMYLRGRVIGMEPNFQVGALELTVGRGWPSHAQFESSSFSRYFRRDRRVLKVAYRISKEAVVEFVVSIRAVMSVLVGKIAGDVHVFSSNAISDFLVAVLPTPMLLVVLFVLFQDRLVTCVDRSGARWNTYALLFFRLLFIRRPNLVGVFPIAPGQGRIRAVKGPRRATRRQDPSAHPTSGPARYGQVLQAFVYSRVLMVVVSQRFGGIFHFEFNPIATAPGRTSRRYGGCCVWVSLFRFLFSLLTWASVLFDPPGVNDSNVQAARR